MEEDFGLCEVDHILAVDLQGLTILSPQHRQAMISIIQSRLPISPENQVRWAQEELPKLTELVNEIEVFLTTEGKLTIRAPRADLENTLLSYQRGSSWFGSIDLIWVVNEALKIR